MHHMFKKKKRIEFADFEESEASDSEGKQYSSFFFIRGMLQQKNSLKRRDFFVPPPTRGKILDLCPYLD